MLNFRKFIGTKDFYRKALALTVPVMIQTGITNFVNMLDNIMVGQVSTVQMSGTSVANQLIFIFNLGIFGVMSGAGIFGAQFAGSGDRENLRNTFRFKVIAGLLIAGAAIAVFLTAGDPLIRLYLKGEGSAEDAQAIFHYAKRYLSVMLIGFLPYAAAQCYASTLRETGKTIPPMVAGVIAVCTNLALNYVLIFGHFGAPALGVEGAAIATVISRFVELGIMVVWTHTNRKKNPFITGAFRSFRIPLPLVGKIVLKGTPLMLNETLWATGIALASQSYSLRGLNVVAANNIVSTFHDVFTVAFTSVGTAIGIILGQKLGANRTKEAKEDAGKLITLAFGISILVGGLFFLCAKWIPLLYETEESVRTLATQLMRIAALLLPLEAIALASYYTIRSGGMVLITMLFDSGYTMILYAPLAMILSNYTTLPIQILYGICQGLNLIKAVAGLILVSKGVWVKNLAQPVSDTKAIAE